MHHEKILHLVRAYRGSRFRWNPGRSLGGQSLERTGCPGEGKRLAGPATDWICVSAAHIASLNFSPPGLMSRSRCCNSGACCLSSQLVSPDFSRQPGRWSPHRSYPSCSTAIFAPSFGLVRMGSVNSPGTSAAEAGIVARSASGIRVRRRCLSDNLNPSPLRSKPSNLSSRPREA